MDVTKFNSFQVKREEWRQCLNGDDLHSIWRQQSSLLWDYALFQTVNEMRRLSDKDVNRRTGFNTSVLRLFDAGFVATQATGIRRLMEKQPKNALKRIISLKALVDDIEENRKLLTREAYLACRELPYDPEPAKQKFLADIASQQQRFSYVGMESKGPNAWAESESAHERFDKLSETSSRARLPEDTVSPIWFEKLDDKLKLCEEVCVFTDKFIAHAADSSSRKEKDADQVRLTLSRLGECHRSILQVSNFIGGPILQDTLAAGVPTPQFDHLENLEKPWIEQRDLDKIREYWNKETDQIEAWMVDSIL